MHACDSLLDHRSFDFVENFIDLPGWSWCAELEHAFVTHCCPTPNGPSSSLTPASASCAYHSNVDTEAEEFSQGDKTLPLMANKQNYEMLFPTRAWCPITKFKP